MIKVLIVGHVGRPVGGLSTYYESFLNSSIQKKIDIVFIDSMSGTKSFSERGGVSLLNLYNGIKLILNLIYELMRFKPHLIDIATSYKTSFLKNSILIILSKISHKKVILRPRCSIRMFIPETDGIWRKYALRILKLCDGIIVLSNEWKELINLLPGPNIIMFPNAIDLSCLSSINRAYEGDIFNILFLGHIGREKGIYELIDAVELLNKSSAKNFKVHVVGETLNKNEVFEVQNVIENKKLSRIIEIKPPVYNEQKLELFKIADIFILPSYHEGMPISLIEAMAAGLPIVATSVGGIPDLIENKVSGILIPPQDSMILHLALKDLLQNRNLRRKIGEAARKKALEKHEIEKHVDDIVRFYYQILKV